MAGRGPAPRDPKLRQRQNRPATAAQLPSEAGRKAQQGRVPLLRPRQREWHELTRAWWRDTWRSPMAQEFLEADRHALYRLATLIDRRWENVDADQDTLDLDREIRLQQQAFGLTPIDRRRLQWQVEDGDETTREPAEATAREQPEPEDPRVVEFRRSQ